MPLSSSSSSGGDDHRGQRWTIAILALALLAACAVGIGVHTLVEAGRPAEARQAAAVEGPSQQAVAGRESGTRGCPKGAVPRVEIDDLQVRPALEDGLSLHAGRNRITLRGDLINDTSAPIVVRAVPLTVGARPWRAHTRYTRVVGPYSSEPVVARGVLVSAGRERMALAARLSWGWRDRDVRPCGRSGLAEDD